MSEGQQADWPITQSEFRKKILAGGRYLCQLKDIKLMTLPNKFNNGAMEPKLMFIFEPWDVVCDKDESADISKLVSPSMSPKGNMLKLLSLMSDTGAVPVEARRDNISYQNYARSFVGKFFTVTCSPSENGNYNNFVTCTPTADPVGADGAKIERAGNGMGTFAFHFDLSKLADTAAENAVKYGKKEDPTMVYFPDKKLLCGNKNPEKLQKYVCYERPKTDEFDDNSAIDDDDIPF